MLLLLLLLLATKHSPTASPNQPCKASLQASITNYPFVHPSNANILRNAHKQATLSKHHTHTHKHIRTATAVNPVSFCCFNCRFSESSFAMLLFAPLYYANYTHTYVHKNIHTYVCVYVYITYGVVAHTRCCCSRKSAYPPATAIILYYTL